MSDDCDIKIKMLAKICIFICIVCSWFAIYFDWTEFDSWLQWCFIIRQLYKMTGYITKFFHRWKKHSITRLQWEIYRCYTLGVGSSGHCNLDSGSKFRLGTRIRLWDRRISCRGNYRDPPSTLIKWGMNSRNYRDEICALRNVVGIETSVSQY